MKVDAVGIKMNSNQTDQAHLKIKSQADTR